MTDASPPVVDRATWERERAELLLEEKALTKAGDALAARRRRLPMVKVDPYTFDGPDGPVTLADLFGGHEQLVVQHFMFAPDWEAGCPSCSSLADDMTHPAHFGVYGLALARVSRAPVERLVAYSRRMGWDVPWVSSGRTTFNEDFGWTDPELGEVPGVSWYLERDGDVFLTYSTTGRGVEPLSGLVGYADRAVFGRQEAWEDSPPGWPQHPTGETTVRRHDEYGEPGGT